MKLWGGRFVKQTDETAFLFNESLSFDKRFYKQDIRGSKAHITMLAKTGIVSEDDKNLIVKALEEIEKEIDEEKLSFDDGSEDIHSFVESHLIDKIGEAGKRLHTGRSRNDQVALDMKLYTRDVTDEVLSLLESLLYTIIRIMKNNKETVMPGFTHLQKAQATTLAHHFGAYLEMFLRDRDRLFDCRRRMNISPLGAGAFAGTTYPLDRELVASLLGFDKATRNSMDSVSDRDYLLELLFDFSLIAMHLSRLSEEIIIWNTDEYRFVYIDDTYSTGSSIMPQKKNPDIAELIRGKTGRVYAALTSLLVTMKALPLAYNKDMQEDKELSFDSMDTVISCLRLMTGMLESLKFNKAVMEKSAKGGFTNATDVADYLVKKGMAFRDAHGVVGSLVLYAEEKAKALDELSLEEFRAVSEIFDKDIYEEISLSTCINKRKTKGAPSPESVEEQIKEVEKILQINT
jgi:argininosuccinate lyase